MTRARSVLLGALAVVATAAFRELHAAEGGAYLGVAFTRLTADERIALWAPAVDLEIYYEGSAEFSDLVYRTGLALHGLAPSYAEDSRSYLGNGAIFFGVRDPRGWTAQVELDPLFMLALVDRQGGMLPALGFGLRMGYELAVDGLRIRPEIGYRSFLFPPALMLRNLRDHQATSVGVLVGF